MVIGLVGRRARRGPHGHGRQYCSGAAPAESRGRARRRRSTTRPRSPFSSRMGSRRSATPMIAFVSRPGRRDAGAAGDRSMLRLTRVSSASSTDFADGRPARGGYRVLRRRRTPRAHARAVDRVVPVLAGEDERAGDRRAAGGAARQGRADSPRRSPRSLAAARAMRADDRRRANPRDAILAHGFGCAHFGAVASIRDRDERPLVTATALFLVSPSRAPLRREASRAPTWSADRRRGASSRRLRRSGDLAAIWRALAETKRSSINVPVVAWKTMLLTPLIALIMARLRGRVSVLVLHEWADLDWRRRIVVGVYAVVARRLVFSSPHVRSASAKAARCAFLDKPSVDHADPLQYSAGAASRRPPSSRAGRRKPRCAVIGHFGSIYPRRCAASCSTSRRRGGGRRVRAIGGFVKGSPRCARAGVLRQDARRGLDDSSSRTSMKRVRRAQARRRRSMFRRRFPDRPFPQHERAAAAAQQRDRQRAARRRSDRHQPPPPD